MAEKHGVTGKQLELLTFIKAYIKINNGVSPTFDEMSEHLGQHSKSGAHRLVAALIKRGHIRSLRGMARSIVVVE